MDVDRFMTRLNPAIAYVLRSPLHPLLSWGLALVTVTGRRTGRRYTIPVGYQQDGDVLTVVVSRARRKQWWRNYREPGRVDVFLRGRRRSGTACVVAPDSGAFADAIERTIRRVPQLARQLGIEKVGRNGLTDAELRTVGANAAVVHIAMDE